MTDLPQITLRIRIPESSSWSIPTQSHKTANPHSRNPDLWALREFGFYGTDRSFNDILWFLLNNKEIRLLKNYFKRFWMMIFCEWSFGRLKLKRQFQYSSLVEPEDALGAEELFCDAEGWDLGCWLWVTRGLDAARVLQLDLEQLHRRRDDDLCTVRPSIDCLYKWFVKILLGQYGTGWPWWSATMICWLPLSAQFF